MKKTLLTTMHLRLCLCLFILGSSCCCTARELASRNPLITETEDVSVLQRNNLEEPTQVQPLEEVNGNEQLCTLCEEYSAKALNYMVNNKMQTEIIDFLHKSCLKMRFYKKECAILVDYYAPLFFLEINKIRPEEFCEKFGLCEQVVTISQVLSGKSCNLCHQVVAEAKSKLKDPDTQLEILELLLKACGTIKPYAKKDHTVQSHFPAMMVYFDDCKMPYYSFLELVDDKQNSRAKVLTMKVHPPMIDALLLVRKLLDTPLHLKDWDIIACCCCYSSPLR